MCFSSLGGGCLWWGHILVKASLEKEFTQCLPLPALAPHSLATYGSTVDGSSKGDGLTNYRLDGAVFYLIDPIWMDSLLLWYKQQTTFIGDTCFSTSIFLHWLLVRSKSQNGISLLRVYFILFLTSREFLFLAFSTTKLPLMFFYMFISHIHPHVFIISHNWTECHFRDRFLSYWSLLHKGNLVHWKLFPKQRPKVLGTFLNSVPMS